MKKGFVKLTSFCIVLSLFLAMFTIFPFANDNGGEDEGVKVIYNRNYEDGWNYSNGFVLDSQYDLDVTLSYLRMSASWHNYFMRLSAGSDIGGYLQLPLGDKSPDTGKLFFEFDMKANAENNIGGIIMISGKGTGADQMLNHIVSMREGVLYLLGENAGEVPTDWTTFNFVFDFDYAESTVGAAADSFRITVEYDGITKERIYTAKGGFGISDIYFGAQENFYGADRDGDEYFLDNVKVYHGVDKKTKLPEKNYGTAVDASALPEIEIMGGGGGSYLSGQPTFERAPYSAANSLIIYNRYWSEGWSYGNGTSSNQERDNEFTIQTDYAADINKGDSGFLNYYLQMVQRNKENGFIRIDGSSSVPRTGKVYLEFDIKASVGATLGGVMSILTPGSEKLEFSYIQITDGALYVLGKNVGIIGEEWCHIALEMDFDYLSIDDPLTPENEATDPTAIKYTAYVGSNPEPIVEVKHIPDSDAAFKGLLNLRIGRSGALTAEHVGDWWGIDNLQLYSSEVGFIDVPDDNLGTMVNLSWTKDFAVNSGFSAPTVEEIVNDGLVMKVNSDKALYFGQKIDLFTDEDGNRYGGPYKNANGKVMVPLEHVLNYTNTPYAFNSGGLACDIYINGEYRSIAIGRSTIELNGEVTRLSAAPEIKSFGENKVIYIGLDDVEIFFNGFYVTYDDSGMIFIAKYDDFCNRVDNADFIKDTAGRFLFEDDITPEEFYELAKAGTNNFDHPFLLATQDRFDYFREAYYLDPSDPEFDEELIWYIDTQIKYADSYMTKYAILDEGGNYVGVKEGQWKPNSQGIVSWDTTQTTGNHSVAIMPYPETGGYDPAGGRLNVLSDGESCLAAALEPCALAYQITRDDKYLLFAYEWTYLLCQWDHWGPGHFLNCANTSRPLSMSLDWLYDFYVEEFGQEAVDYLQSRIFRNGVNQGWITLNRLPQEHPRPQGDGSKYWNHIGNWNICGAIGMTTASLVVMEHEEYVEKASFVCTESLYYYVLNGLEYIDLDGGYREAAGYWGIVRMHHSYIKIIGDVLGDDLGLGDCPGMNITDYFGCHTEGTNFDRWNFHDDWNGTQPSYWYYLSAQLYDNPEFAAIRYTQIHTGDSAKAPNRYDILYYDRELIESVKTAEVQLGLDYVMTGIAAVMSRASWEPGSLYVGFMGGGNNVAHGQYDSGNWMYENMGTRWFVDLGADDYNLYGGGRGGGYYKYSAEGNNCVAITSKPDLIPHGQVLNAFGTIKSTVVNEYGTATVIDQSAIYGGASIVSYARRGMLFTNDRKTVVIQDEIVCVQAQNLQWFAHYDTNTVPEVEISSNGRTVLMKDKKGQVLRVSMLTANRGFKFEIQKCDDPEQFALAATPLPGYSLSMKGIDEQNRSNFRRLTIKAENVVKFEVAVVIEIIDPNNPIEVGYKTGWDGNPAALVPMESWVPGPDTREGIDDSLLVEDEAPTRGPAMMTTILYNAPALNDYILSGAYIGTDRSTFFTMLSDIEYAINFYSREMLMGDPTFADAVVQYDAAKEKYDKYQQKSQDATKGLNNIVGGLVGIKTEAAPETTPEG